MVDHSTTRIASVLQSCKTPEHVETCRSWITDLALRQKIDRATAAVLDRVADAVQTNLAPSRRGFRAGAAAAPAVI